MDGVAKPRPGSKAESGGTIVARHYVVAAIGVDPTGAKHMFGLANDSSESAETAKEDLPASVADHKLDKINPAAMSFICP